MSRAFVKEDAASEELPERLVSQHRNLVTPAGFQAIELEVLRLSRLYAEAQTAGDRDQLNLIARDLRYWTARRGSAEVVNKCPDSNQVRFGSTVTIVRADGRRQVFQIVGEDEADPTQGKVSYVSPLARALLGASRGDEVRVGHGNLEIMDIG